MTTKALIASFSSGLIFAVGLGISGMTQPSKVIGFLDLFGGAWDPSLAFVMAGAIAVHLPLYFLFRAQAPKQPALTDGCGVVDMETASSQRRARSGPQRVPIMLGAAIFGVGWALGGYCPGPALVSLPARNPGVLLFVAAMLVGMAIFRYAFERESQLPAARDVDESLVTTAASRP